MAAQCRDIDSLWKDYFRDPSQWQDYRSTKTNPRFPDFKHKRTKEPLWIDGRNNPAWVGEELTRRGLQINPQGSNQMAIASNNDRMYQEDTAALLASLKACAKQKDLCKGSRIHDDIHESGLLASNVYVASSLLNMYAKCGAMEKAQEVFDELPAHNVVLWNALIAGYTKQGQGHKALRYFEQMQQQGFSPNAVTFTCILKACGSMGATEKGEEIHAEIVRQGLLDNNTILGTALVDMYAKCGALAKSQEVFDKLRVQDVVAWNVLIAGYAQHGHGHEALNCFEQMQKQGLSPDAVTFTCILKACGSMAAAEKGEAIHAEVARQRLLDNNTVLSTALVDMYAKCGVLAKARAVFEELLVQDVVCWNALIAGYAHHGHGREALNCFEQMQQQGLSPDIVTFISVLKACSSIGAAEKGEEIHAEIVRQQLLERNTLLSTALVDMYAKCGAFAKAREIISNLPVQHVESWNALMAGYAQQGQGHVALKCFEQMKQLGLAPDAVTFTCVFKACGTVGAADKGEEVHAEVVRQGLLAKHPNLGTALVDMYAKCGALAKAQEVFDELPVQNLASWNALIAGYYQHGYGHKAMNCFEQIKQQGLSPDTVTFICSLQACGSIGAVEKGEEIHAEVVRQGLLETNTLLGNALVDMYAKCGVLSKAQEVFEELPVKDLVSWNAIIAGYAQHGHGNEAILCFEKMQQQGFSPDAVTFTCILKACGSIGAAEKGEETHAEVVRQGLLKKDILLSTALVDMYAKCGALAKAQEVFDELPVQNVSSWNALIAGYGQLGKIETVFDLFDRMIREGTKPDAVTFIILLNACSHSGLIDQGQMYFVTMSTSYGIFPTLDHYICMVDLYGRAGHLEKATELVEKMPPSYSSEYFLLWSALLGACRKWGNVKIGNLAFEHVIQLDEKDAAAYVLMGDIYADSSR